MKTHTTLFKVLGLMMVVAALGACGKKGAPAEERRATTSYVMVNGSCVNQANNRQVDYTYCQRYNNQYGYNNGYNYGYGYPNGGYNGGRNGVPYTGNGSYGQQCTGIFYVRTWGGFAAVNCSTGICRGQVLVNSWGQSVFCP